MTEEQMFEMQKTASFNLLKGSLRLFLVHEFGPCDGFLREFDATTDEPSMKRLFRKYKHEAYQRLGGSDDEDTINELRNEIDGLERDIAELEEELDDSKVISGNSLDDEFKRKFILEYHNKYTPWELETLLKNGKKYLNNENTLH